MSSIEIQFKTFKTKYEQTWVKVLGLMNLNQLESYQYNVKVVLIK